MPAVDLAISPPSDPLLEADLMLQTLEGRLGTKEKPSVEWNGAFGAPIISPPPCSVGSLASVALGAYTEITQITAPPSATAGQSVTIEATVKNLHTANIYIAVTGLYDTAELRFTPEYAIVEPGANHTFRVSFTMPNHNVEVWAFSHYWTGTDWYQDDQDSVDIALAVAWAKLATKTVTITPITWQKLATKTVTITPAEVPPAEWVKLASKTITLTPAEVPIPEYKLVQHTEYPRGKTFVGTASQCTFTFKLFPEQIPGAGWLGIKVATAFADKVVDKGSEMLDLKIYEDTSPMLWTNYMVIATCIETSPFPWAVVIPLILAILFIVAITFLIKEVKTIDWGKPVAAIPVLAILLGVGALAGIGLAAAAAKKRR